MSIAKTAQSQDPTFQDHHPLIEEMGALAQNLHEMSDRLSRYTIVDLSEMSTCETCPGGQIRSEFLLISSLVDRISMNILSSSNPYSLEGSEALKDCRIRLRFLLEDTDALVQTVAGTLDRLRSEHLISRSEEAVASMGPAREFPAVISVRDTDVVEDESAVVSSPEDEAMNRFIFCMQTGTSDNPRGLVSVSPFTGKFQEEEGVTPAERQAVRGAMQGVEAAVGPERFGAVLGQIYQRLKDAHPDAAPGKPGHLGMGYARHHLVTDLGVTVVAVLTALGEYKETVPTKHEQLAHFLEEIENIEQAAERDLFPAVRKDAIDAQVKALFAIFEKEIDKEVIGLIDQAVWLAAGSPDIPNFGKLHRHDDIKRLKGAIMTAQWNYPAPEEE